MEKNEAQATGSAWHTLTREQVLSELHCSADGLDEAEVAQRLEEFGPNSLPEPERKPALLRFLAHFRNILIYVLMGSAVITVVLEHYFDAAVILAVILANAVIGFIQEGKAEKALNAIRHMLALRAAVLRAGKRQLVNGTGLVPGDIVLLEAGDKVPADIRLLQSHSLQIQEAVLTGESLPVEKHVEPVAGNVPLGDRSSMAFSGTLVSSGMGKGVVVATGSSTEIGRISDLIAGVQTLTTPLVNQMNVFAKWLTAVVLVIATVLLVYGSQVIGMAFTDLFMAVVGLSVAAIPEGLPAVMTITLAVGVQAMARRHAIVRRLPAIETLGSVSVICTDKTGTLTRNEMMVASIISGRQLFSLQGTGYEPNGAIHLDAEQINGMEHKVLEQLALAAILCNDASLHQKNGLWTVEGDPMEGALLAMAGKIGRDVHRETANWTRTDAIPFDTRTRFMASLNHDHEKHAFLSVKGAPEKVLEMCRWQMRPDGSQEDLDQAWWQEKIEEVAGQGQRLLALAICPVEPGYTVLENEDLPGKLVLVGMTGLIDPPRTEAIEAVRECHAAGIRVKMITGDHGTTALAIARQIGLENTGQVMTGQALDTMDDAALARAIVDIDVFARTSPEHKLRIVQALQGHQLSVAMTGDGVNDAPALKRADIGIAMGMKGSEAAREAAEIVLTDDNFASIVAAVREGRTVYDNIKKVISWTLPTNAGEALTIIFALLFGMTLPVTPIQILWINLITAVTLGIALAFEPTESNTMQRPPRAKNQSLITLELGWHIVLVSLLFLAFVFGIFQYALENGKSIETARTMAINTLVVMEIFHLFFVRNIYGTSLTLKAVKGTPVVWLTVGVITLAQLAITYVPVLQAIFGTRPVSIPDGLLILASGVILFAIIEVEKQVRLALLRGRSKRPASVVSSGERTR